MKLCRYFATFKTNVYKLILKWQLVLQEEKRVKTTKNQAFDGFIKKQ